MICWCNDAKNAKNDLSFCPNQTDFESAGVARNFAALLALFRFMKNMPLENKLPEPYNVTWKAMVAADKEEEKEKEKKDRKSKVSSANTNANVAQTKASADSSESGSGGGISLNAGAGVSDSSSSSKAQKILTLPSSSAHVISPPPPPLPEKELAVAVPVLSAAIADWLCISCNQQNFAKLQSGVMRTKCFKCGNAKSDDCELVVSTQAVVNVPLKKAPTDTFKKDKKEEQETPEEAASFGFFDSGSGSKKGDKGPGGGLSGKGDMSKPKYQEKKAGLSKKEKVQALLDLKNNKKGGSVAETERVRQEISIMKNRKRAYFDAVKRANKPTTVILSPTLRLMLEQALGLDASIYQTQNGSVSYLSNSTVPIVKITLEEYVASMEGSAVVGPPKWSCQNCTHKNNVESTSCALCDDDRSEDASLTATTDILGGSGSNNVNRTSTRVQAMNCLIPEKDCHVNAIRQRLMIPQVGLGQV